MTAEEREALREDIRALRAEVREDLAKLTGRTPEEIEAAVAEYEMPDPEDLESIPADEFYGDE